MALQGWEVKSLRAGRVQLDQAYVLLKAAKPGYLALSSPVTTPPPISTPTHSAPENY